ncbi:MAG: BspA family leucine-rich repeat surface protein [Lachnospiraceae bacterium]|nr:BspA family leucine-rich repeat surface protein [Lachnospiraceae bacterium]
MNEKSGMTNAFKGEDTMKIKRIQSVLIALLLIVETIVASAPVTSVNAQTVSENTVEKVETGVTEQNIPITQEDVKAETEGVCIMVKDSGFDGDLDWTLFVDGRLTISGDGDYDYTGKRLYSNTGWHKYKNEITSAEVSVSEISSMYRMFNGCCNLKKIDFMDSDMQGVTDMNEMFKGCTSLLSVNFNGMDTGGVTDMCGMFDGCSSLKNLNLSDLDTGNVKYMSWMFRGCSALTDLDLSGFDTRCVTTMPAMFSGCSGLKNLDLSGFDTRKVTSMSGMFNGCSSLNSLDLSGFDTSQVTAMGKMFCDCDNLTYLNIKSFRTTKVDDMNHMFSGCRKLNGLDISNFDVGNLTYAFNMFDGCISLQSLKSPSNILLEIALPVVDNFLWIDTVGNRHTVLKRGMSASVVYTRHNPISVSETTVSAIPNQIYTAKDLTPKPVVTYQGTKLTEGTDYTLSYANNTNPGTATITITGNGKYTGTKTVTFKIEVKLDKSKLDTYELNYQKGNVGKLTSKMYFSLYLDFVPVDYATKYEIELTNNKGKKVKTVKVNCANKDYVEKTIKNLTGTIYGVRIRAVDGDVYGPWSTKRYVIRQPRAQARTTKGYVQIKWEKISGATGYDIYMSTKKNSGFKKVASAGKNTTLKTIKKFNKKKLKTKTYYYYVVAKKKVGSKTYKSTKSYTYKVKNKA